MTVDTAAGKKPFDIDLAVERIAKAVEPYPKAAMFELAERGYDTPFQQLVACVISIRTRDEESLPISIRLFAAAPTAEDIVTLTPQQIDALIRPSTFHERKADQIHAIATRSVEDLIDEPCCGAYPALAEKRRQQAASFIAVERRKPERRVTDPT